MSFLKSFFHFTEGIIDLPINTNPPIPHGIKIAEHKDFVYDVTEPEVCRLDTYHVPGSAPYPILVYIHGGGFVAGDKKKRRGICRWFASLGYYVVNLNYGLCPEFTYPVPLEHFCIALNWIASHAKRLKFDLEKIVVAGDSAGAYYAAQVAAITSDPTLQERLGLYPKARIGAAILNCGLYDIGYALKQKIIFDVNSQIFETFTGVKDEEFERYEYKDICSPLDRVTPSYPPTCVLYAKQDLFCAGQSELLLKKLRENGVYCEDFHSEGFFSNHCFSLLWSNRKAQEANHLVEAFLRDFAEGKIDRRKPGSIKEDAEAHPELLLDDSVEEPEPED